MFGRNSKVNLELNREVEKLIKTMKKKQKEIPTNLQIMKMKLQRES